MSEVFIGAEPVIDGWIVEDNRVWKISILGVAYEDYVIPKLRLKIRKTNNGQVLYTTARVYLTYRAAIRVAKNEITSGKSQYLVIYETYKAEEYLVLSSAGKLEPACSHCLRLMGIE